MITSNKNEKWHQCYLCESKNSSIVYKHKKLVKCLDCSFVYFEEIPSNEQLDMVYSKYTREEYITPSSMKKIQVEFENILGSNKISNVIDIACGECYALDVLKSIDPNLNLYATEHHTAKQNVLSKGYHFIEGEFFPVTDIKFDLIIFTEAIEHINDVNSFLESANGILRPGGLIYITTPNFSSLERRIMQSKWGMVMPPEHLSYFTPKTIEHALSRNQFTKVFSRTENISVFRIIEFLNKHYRKSVETKNAKLSPQKISDNMQKITESNPPIKFIKLLINFILNTFNLGSSMKVLYKKNNI